MQREQQSFTNLFKIMSSQGGSSSNDMVADTGNLLQTYRLNEKLCLTVAQGSVLDFVNPKTGAIVNAANEECLGGGGVDGAITMAGGENLAEDRYNLPKIQGVRCPTGDAKLTGPGDYGDLNVPFVIHAVGPNYMMFDEENDVETPHSLLRSAYQNSMDCALGTPIEQVGFALLSAGVFRGFQSLATVLGIGVEAIYDWSKDETKMSQSNVEDVVLYAFTDREARTLVRVCDIILSDADRIGPPPKQESKSVSSEEEENGAKDMDEVKTEEESKPIAEDDKTNPDVADEKVEESCEAAVKLDTEKEEEMKTETVEEKAPPTGSAGETGNCQEDQKIDNADAKVSESEQKAQESQEDKDMTDTEDKGSPTKA